MSYILFTGATGLLGGYLLRDLFAHNHRLAVVVRHSRLASAQTRIETLLAYWERIAGHALPRPIVLVGDISEPRLGFDEKTLDWIARNCDAVLHNAASLSFEATSDGEPYRSNIDGTKNVLDVCERTGIREFFHVSTAYVCGRRTGRILESELDVGQEPANPYEESKITAEKMVRGAAFLNLPTVFRPAIIVGDSVSGYTTTFHGLYAPLKGVHALSGLAGEGAEAGDLMRTLGFDGTERKHFIPVDWVSAVMVHVISTPSLHRETYHLAPDEPISVGEVTDAMARAVAKHGSSLQGGNREPSPFAGGLGLLQQFENLLAAYRSYWRDDPAFDKTNTIRAAGHIPCPPLNVTLLDRLCQFAIRTNFGWPKPKLAVPEIDFVEVLGATDLVGEGISHEGQPIGLQVNGPGGGQWTLLGDHELKAISLGLADNVVARLYLNASSLRRIIENRTTVEMSIATGRLLIEGPKAEHARATRLLSDLCRIVSVEKVAT